MDTSNTYPVDCYDCGKTFDVTIDELQEIGYGDFAIEESIDGMHILYNVDNERNLIIDAEYYAY